MPTSFLILIANGSAARRQCSSTVVLSLILAHTVCYSSYFLQKTAESFYECRLSIVVLNYSEKI